MIVRTQTENQPMLMTIQMKISIVSETKTKWVIMETQIHRVKVVSVVGVAGAWKVVTPISMKMKQLDAIIENIIEVMILMKLASESHG